MTKRFLGSLTALLAVIVVVSPAAVPVAGQTTTTAAKTAKTWMPPRTPWGDPDLQGIWPSTEMVGVPFERSRESEERLFLTGEEFAQREEQARKQLEADNAGEGAGFNTPSGNQILQSPGHVAIRYEMIHETRSVPVDGRPHVGRASAHI